MAAVGRGLSTVAAGREGWDEKAETRRKDHQPDGQMKDGMSLTALGAMRGGGK
jgi:hypothetical protein